MKRSEMIKLIAEHINNALFVKATNLSELHADHLLHDIEKIGMKPPKRLHADYIPTASRLTKPSKKTEQYISNTWEPENE